MSLTIPTYSYNPWDGVYSPWQLDFQKVAPEDNSTDPVNQITTGQDKLELTEQEKQQALRATFGALSFISLISPLIGRLTCLSVGVHKSMSSMNSLVHGTGNKASALLGLTVAVASTTWIILKHPIGLGILAGQEAIFNGYALGSSLLMGNFSLALENSLFLANNSLYIAALFYCSLEIVFISLVLQVLVQGYKAYGEIRKGNSFEGFLHSMMGAMRLLQVFSLGDILLVKWIIKADVEIWKEGLSPQENAIKETLGMKYLYLKKGDKREKFLILSAQSDHNDFLEPKYGTFLKNTEKLNERFDVKYRTISKVEDIKAEIELATQTGKVTGLMLRAHGTPVSMEFGSDPVSGILWKETIPTGIFSKLDPECVIVLQSCNTAKLPNSSIAYEIASQSQRVTYASDSIVYASELRLASLNPLEWRFDGRGVEKTKIIFPNTRT